MLFSAELVQNRAIFLFIFLFALLTRNLIRKDYNLLIQFIILYAALSLLYKETATINRLYYPVLDPMLTRWDELIFGFQPSLEFSKAIHYALFSELMFMSYFSYYLMPLAVLLLTFSYIPSKTDEFGFIFITSFLIYYLIFVFFPAVGPQFYFPYPENQIEAKGIFGHIIKIIQENGEAPTAAFPSSHVGIATILSIWLAKNLKKYLKFFIPIVILLILATVYIKAHFAVDVFTGLLTAPLVYWISTLTYKWISNYGNSPERS